MKYVKCPSCEKSNAIEIKMTTRTDGDGFDMDMKPCKYCKIAFDWKSYNEKIKEKYYPK